MFTTAYCVAGTASAQDPAVRQPTITRMCLWNGDKTTWRALDLKRSQVMLLAVIRQRYPAVVAGQWNFEEDSAATYVPDPALSDPAFNPTATAAMRGMQGGSDPGNARSSGVRKESIGLQAELREVLTFSQLRKWEALCK